MPQQGCEIRDKESWVKKQFVRYGNYKTIIKTLLCLLPSEEILKHIGQKQGNKPNNKEKKCWVKKSVVSHFGKLIRHSIHRMERYNM